MDWQTNNDKPSDINVQVKKIALDSSGRSIRSDYVSKIKTIRTQNMNNFIMGNLDINSLVSKVDDLKVLMTGMFDIF